MNYIDDELMHYGTKRHSGRYEWGSGENPYQHENWFLSSVNELKAKGLSEKEIADYFGISTTELREKKSIAKDEKRAADLAEAIRLYDKGWSKTAIAERLGSNESYVRYLLQPTVQDRVLSTENTANILKDRVGVDNYIDITEGSQYLIGISKQKMNTAVRKLEEEGYTVHYIKVEQPNLPGKYTYIKVLAKPGTEWSEVNQNRDQIQLIQPNYTKDGGKTFLGIEPPKSVSSDRLQVRYAEEGGKEKDGVIELRRGVEDLSLGNSNYAQVRIAVDDTHYLKGMAIYSDDMPPGVDIIFNTNKHVGTPVMGPKDNTVLKNLKADKDNPFGSNLKVEDGIIVGQQHYIDKDGNRQLSPINIVREEGDWKTWSNTLSSQFLSKQPISLIKQQLDLTYDRQASEFDKINALTNPEVKKKLLIEYADECDAAASHLKAAALPRQSSKVIIPLTDLKDDECYAPTYRDGEYVALVRHPHGGTFEIPVLKVNNGIISGKKTLGEAPDAIGINHKVAERLSGADFDGDSVLVIPMAGQKIKATSPLKGLQDFDPKESYPGYKGMKVMKNTQNEMGRISNLITDMTIKGADDSEIARAVRHSMVVIDAEKHELNYKQSYIDNGIAQLKEKYQPEGGASTIISRAGSEAHPLKRKPSEEGVRIGGNHDFSVDPKTGEKLYSYTGETYQKAHKNKNGEIDRYTTVYKKAQASTKMAETKDASTLSSGFAKEEPYVVYANKLKALANRARKEAVTTPSQKISPSAKKTYAEEVSSLAAKLNNALKNKPYERQAQLIASVIIEAKQKDNPSMTSDELKKVRTQALNEARNKTGANKKAVLINITDKEWEAIQAGAISSTTLSKILDNSDPAKIRQLATPVEFRSPSTADISRMKDLSARGYTLAEIADVVGFSSSTVYDYVKD